MRVKTLLGLFSILASAASAAVVHVPGDQPTIMDGLAAAGAGDTVLVAPGVYEENLFWPATPGIRLIGAEGAEATVIDGRSLGGVLEIASGVDSTTLVRGFTLSHGRAYGG